MTKKEALEGELQVSVSEFTLEKALIDADQVGEEEYTATDKELIALTAVQILQGLLAAPDVSEGGYSIKYDRASIEKRLSYLETELGLSGQPAIRAPQVW